jgi:hypothetical protein
MSHDAVGSVYILIGREDRDTRIAKKLLSEAGVDYTFAHAGISEGALPQLISGLNSFVGLEQISRLAKRAQRNHRTT